MITCRVPCSCRSRYLRWTFRSPRTFEASPWGCRIWAPQGQQRVHHWKRFHLRLFFPSPKVCLSTKNLPIQWGSRSDWCRVRISRNAEPISWDVFHSQRSAASIATLYFLKCQRPSWSCAQNLTSIDPWKYQSRQRRQWSWLLYRPSWESWSESFSLKRGHPGWTGGPRIGFCAGGSW